MASALHMANAAVNAEADALARALDNGYLRIYDSTGTGQPATADTAVSTQQLLAEIRVSATSAPGATAGVLTFTVPISDTDANATGTATWYRALKSDGTTSVMDGSVGAAASACDMILNSTAIQIHAQVDVTSWSHTVPKS